VKYKVYVGEDCPAETTMLQSLFATEQRVQLRIFGDGVELLGAIHRERPVCLVLDLTLPALDGFLLLRLIKFDRVLSDLPVLCMSGIREPSLAARLEELGGQEHLLKPWDGKQLLGWVQKHLPQAGS
jgi:CheY-like chemotaxis protein